MSRLFRVVQSKDRQKVSRQYTETAVDKMTDKNCLN